MCWLKNVWLTGGVDFNTATLTATFASEVSTSNVSVIVFVDNIVESPEEFDLTLNVPASLGPAITVGSMDNAVGVITDSTSKCIVNIIVVTHGHTNYEWPIHSFIARDCDLIFDLIFVFCNIVILCYGLLFL